MTDIETRAEEIIDAVRTGFVVYDESGTYITVNEQYANFFDSKPKVLEGKAIWDINPEFERERFEEYWNSFDIGQTRIRNAWHEFAGESIPVKTYTNCDDISGEIYHFGTVQDITNLREQRRERIKFQKAIESAHQAIFITDPDGSIRYVNPAFEEITGYSAQEALGESPNLLNSEQVSDEVWEDLWQTVSAGQEWRGQIINRQKSGQFYYADQTVTPIFDDNRSIRGYVAVQNDITEQVEREQTLRLLSRVLRHNLRNRINVIMSTGEALKNTHSGTDEYDQLIETSNRLAEIAKKGHTLVNFLSQETHLQRIELVDIVENIVDQFNERYPNASFEVTLPETAPVLAVEKFSEALEELVSNSIIHNDTSPEIEVRITEDGTQRQLQIRDNGPVIPKEEKKILKGELDPDQLSHGSGLGLSLVYWIIRRSGGIISYEENSPRGNVVFISLDKTATEFSY